MRDSKGRFICGHEVLTSRDKTTGRFCKKLMEPISLEKKVDRLLAERSKNEFD